MTYTGARREFTGLTFLLLATNSAALNPSITNGAVKGVSPGSVRFQSFATFLQKKQVDILSAIEEADGSGASFQRDPWERPGDGSFGLTTCIEEGALVEKGAASVSIIHGVLTEVHLMTRVCLIGECTALRPTQVIYKPPTPVNSTTYRGILCRLACGCLNIPQCFSFCFVVTLG